jgi:hypothetical protein
MSKTYSKQTFVTAEQFKPTTAEKESLVKDKEGKQPYTPAILWGDTLKKRKDTDKNGNEFDRFYVTTTAGGEKIEVSENEWLVNEGGKFYVKTAEQFKAEFTEVEEVAAETEAETEETGGLID